MKMIKHFFFSILMTIILSFSFNMMNIHGFCKSATFDGMSFKQFLIGPKTDSLKLNIIANLYGSAYGNIVYRIEFNDLTKVYPNQIKYFYSGMRNKDRFVIESVDARKMGKLTEVKISYKHSNRTYYKELINFRLMTMEFKSLDIQTFNILYYPYYAIYLENNQLVPTNFYINLMYSDKKALEENNRGYVPLNKIIFDYSTSYNGEKQTAPFSYGRIEINIPYRELMYLKCFYESFSDSEISLLDVNLVYENNKYHIETLNTNLSNNCITRNPNKPKCRELFLSRHFLEHLNINTLKCKIRFPAWSGLSWPIELTFDIKQKELYWYEKFVDFDINGGFDDNENGNPNERYDINP